MKCSTLSAALAAICAVVVSSAVASSEVGGGGNTGRTAREIRIHSHNDYAQKRPFWGAYEAGADSIEADVFLVDGELLVAHSRKGLKKENTLRRLYLEPLREVMRKNGGRARANGKPLQLVIDLKSGKPALDALLTLIEQEGFRECFDICKNPSAVRLSVGGDISEIKDFLESLNDAEKYGTVLRAKGIVDCSDGGGWIHFDYVPGEPDVREGKANVIGRLCVIGCKLREENLVKLFKL